MALDSRERWIRAAAGWEANADAFQRDAIAVSSWMVDAIAPQPGHVILDLAAGVGDTGYLAAELIRPGGELITSDFAPEMLAAAQRRAQAQNITNVRFRQMDGNLPLDQPAASLDGVLSRWGYMLLNDGEAALRETRRILKQNGRVALAAWTSPDENLWSAAPVRLLIAKGALEREEPGQPGQFAWAKEGEIAVHMENAGFIDPEIARIEFAMRYADVDAWWVAQSQLSPRTADADAQLDFATRSDVLAELEAIAEPFTQADDSLVIPAATWVAAATA
jgi:SAM-dependent methyltransferase